MTSTKQEIEVSYDVSNEFFRLWLDERMHYTCAVYEKDTDTLDIESSRRDLLNTVPIGVLMVVAVIAAAGVILLAVWLVRDYQASRLAALSTPDGHADEGEAGNAR